MSKLRVALFFGGVSSEHEVSCISAAAWVRALDKEKYQLTLVGITKEGRWLRFAGSAGEMADGSWVHHPDNLPCTLSPDRADHGLLLRTRPGTAELLPLDAAVPVLHGKNGEDGTIQGLLQLAGIPYVGCGVLGSAVCMDKAVANTLMDANGIPHCHWCYTIRAEAECQREALLRRVEARLEYPIFVKPANAGSSVGITKAADRAALDRAIDVALAEDDKVVFEQFIEGQEVECAVIGNPDAPASVRAMAHKVYYVLGCTGLARCDFFVENGTGRVLCNEVNTMPGFTAISMYPKLMEQEGLDFAALADRLIGLALSRRKGAY